jgi:hypothetical protein
MEFSSLGWVIWGTMEKGLFLEAGLFQRNITYTVLAHNDLVNLSVGQTPLVFIRQVPGTDLPALAKDWATFYC